MSFAFKARTFKDAGNEEEWHNNLISALAYEREAAELLTSHLEAEPTRGVLFRSAATMAYNLGSIYEAKRLIGLGLNGNVHAEIATELKDLLKQCNAK